LSPETVDEVKVRAKRREGIRRRAYKGGKQGIGLEFPEPGGKAGEAEHYHKNEGADDLYLVFSGSSNWRIESGEIFHNRIKIQQAQFLANGIEFQMESSALRRIKMYFCLMQEIQIFLMGLPVN